MNAQLKREPITQSGTRRSKRQAFTLVELLVVITIIGILVALLIPAVTGAISNAKNARIAIEVQGLASAMEAYKLKHGAYPPDFALDANKDGEQIVNHLARNFRYRNKAQDVYSDISVLDPAEALVFWLSGLSSNQKFPLTGRESYSDLFPAKIKSDQPFFEFDQSRLRDNDGDGWPEYYPADLEMPYVYMVSQNYGISNDSGTLSVAAPHAILNGATAVKAYSAEWATSSGETALTSNDAVGVKRFANADKFQILCAGQDNLFGGVVQGNQKVSPTFAEGVGYSEADEDNIANFSESTLKAAMP